MRKPKANCRECAWHAISASEIGVVDMARDHQRAVGHTIRVSIPEGAFFGWKSYDFYPIPGSQGDEKLAAAWNPPYRYNGD